MVRLKVNGKSKTFEGDETMPLLWYLRDELKLIGTRFGCGQALCGACTVHIDGVAQRSCITPISVLDGRSVTTIEGLSKKGDHPVQKAWAEHRVPQCGFCQAGQMMQAASFLKENPSPTDEEIDAVMSGNICRCGTYTRIRSAIKDAGKELAGVQFYDAAEHKGDVA